jgi:hypothetical protein
MHIIILEKENEFSPHPRAYNVKKDQMRATQFIHRRIERAGAVEIKLKSACTQRENVAQVHARMMYTCGVK